MARIAAAVYLETLSPELDTSPLRNPIAVGEMKEAIFGDMLAIKEKTATLASGGIILETLYIACGIVMLMLIPPIKETPNTTASDCVWHKVK